VCGERKLTGVRRGGEVGLEWWEEAKYYLSLLFYLAVIHGMDPWNGSQEVKCLTVPKDNFNLVDLIVISH